jgi:hypothetical protein
VEDIVQPSSRRQCDLIRNFTHTLNYLIGPEEFWTKLATTLHNERHHRPMQEPDPDPITHLKYDLPILIVIVHFIVLLCLLEAALDFLQKPIPVHHLLVYRLAAKHLWAYKCGQAEEDARRPP